MKKLQKFFAILLAVSMCMSLLSVNTFAAEEKTSNIQVVEEGGKVYYLANAQAGDVAGENNFDVWTSKTIAGTLNEDQFEITLQVGTTMKAVPNDVAVVLVMDTSGSMMWDENGNKWEDGNVPAGKKLRIEYAREAALEFAESFATGAGSAQRMMAVVEFGNSAYAPLQWTDANKNGTLNPEVARAIEAVDVNFKYDEGVSFWDQAKAETDFPGKTACWNGDSYSPEMKDYFEDCFQSYCQSSMTDCFVSYFSPKTVTQEIDGVPTEVEVTSCSKCDVTTEHKHCSYEACTVEEAHKHCAVVDCAVKGEHVHCSKCDATVEHTHCSECDAAEEHTHCSYDGCTVADAHTHCVECGDTAEHTHIVGCTLSGCTDTTPGHVHYCVYGGHATYTRYYNGYRCLRSDPNHTHEMYDGDSCRTMEDRELQKFKAIGTNMEGGLLLARNLVNTGLAKGGAIEGIDDVYVIILTDGNPTFYTDSTSTTETEFVVGLAGGFNKSNWTDVVDIVSNEVAEGAIDQAIAEDIKEVADLYAILYGTSMGQKLDGDSHVLSNVTGAEWFKTKGTNYVGADAVFDSPEAGGLNTVFAEIKDRIDMLAKAWVVTDEMGGIELGDDVTFEKFTLNGEYAAATPATNSKNTTVSWSLGAMDPESGNGSIQNPYVYTLKYMVTLNSAKDNVKEISLAHDAGTAQEAVWTNNGANLQYFMVEESLLDNMTADEISAAMRTAAFERPSVKGIYGDYEFVKKNGEAGGAVMEGVGFTLYDSNNQAYGEEVFSDSEGKVTFTDIPRGEYKLKETTVPEGMQQMNDLDLKVSWGEVTTLNGRALPAEIYNYKPYVGGSDPDPDPNPNPDPDPDPDPDPGVTIPDEDPPLSNIPDEEPPLAELPDEDPPLAELPEEEVPLAVLPATGDASALWMVLSALSGAGLFVTRKKRDEE